MLTIGLMSGTSLDGVDGVLAEFSLARAWRVVAAASQPFPEALRAEFDALNRPGADELHRAALAGNGLARVYAHTVADLLRRAALGAEASAAIGAHGQTVRHRPQEFDGTGYTLQLNNPALLAELCGIPVVADLRSRDLAAGGQGAPLVPPFHAAWFSREDEPVAILNLGGIANLSLLPPRGTAAAVRGFDCGPANTLLDAWCRRHTGQAFDADGAWARTGRVRPDLLARLLAEPYFERLPPKSTGRDLFSLAWLQAHLDALAPAARPADVQATLAELSARSVARDLARHAAGTRAVVCCGGGARNTDLLQRLSAAAPDCRFTVSDALGLPCEQVEAAAFAWLAWRHLSGQPASDPAVTGARGPRMLGALYPC